jgi:hypothetical protein
MADDRCTIRRVRRQLDAIFDFRQRQIPGHLAEAPVLSPNRE